MTKENFNSKIFFAMVMLATIEIAKNPAKAFVFPDQETNADESENSDAVSRWGSDRKIAHKKTNVKPQVLVPISENSFIQSEPSRGPASVGRGPAKVASLDQSNEMNLPLPKAHVRAIAKSKAYQETALIASEQGFFPRTIFVTQGIPVRIFITGASPRSQCFMLDDFGVRRQIRSQKIEEINFTPDQAGTFTFNCPLNGASGVLVVKDLIDGGRVPASSLRRATEEGIRPRPRLKQAVEVGQAPSETGKGSLIQDSDFTQEFQGQ